MNVPIQSDPLLRCGIHSHTWPWAQKWPVLSFVLCLWNLNKGLCIPYFALTWKLHNQPSSWTLANLTMLCFCSKVIIHTVVLSYFCAYLPPLEKELCRVKDLLCCVSITPEEQFHRVKTLMRRQEDCSELFRKRMNQNQHLQRIKVASLQT